MRLYQNKYPAYRMPVSTEQPNPLHHKAIWPKLHPLDSVSLSAPVEQPVIVLQPMDQEWATNRQPQPQVPLKPTPLPIPEAHLPQVDEKPIAPNQTAALPQQTDWEAIAKQQQAEMDNFRKRQTHRANEAIRAEKERLLRLVLPVADNLERALKQSTTESETLRQGIELTQRELTHLLQAEGVARMDTVGNIFNPQWHEAIASLPGQAVPNTIITEIEGGYILHDKLLRPAKVVVAA